MVDGHFRGLQRTTRALTAATPRFFLGELQICKRPIPLWYACRSVGGCCTLRLESGLMAPTSCRLVGLPGGWGFYFTSPHFSCSALPTLLCRALPRPAAPCHAMPTNCPLRCVCCRQYASIVSFYVRRALQRPAGACAPSLLHCGHQVPPGPWPQIWVPVTNKNETWGLSRDVLSVCPTCYNATSGLKLWCACDSS
jgi:hypothetical protein